MKDTLKVMRMVKTDILDVSSFVPLPGGRLYDGLSDGEKTIDWSKVGFKSFNNHFSKRVPQEVLNKYLRDAFQIADDLRKQTFIRHSASVAATGH